MAGSGVEPLQLDFQSSALPLELSSHLTDGMTEIRIELTSEAYETPALPLSYSVLSIYNVFINFVNDLSADIAFAGFRFFGQHCTQFKIAWHLYNL